MHVGCQWRGVAEVRRSHGLGTVLATPVRHDRSPHSPANFLTLTSRAPSSPPDNAAHPPHHRRRLRPRRHRPSAHPQAGQAVIFCESSGQTGRHGCAPTGAPVYSGRKLPPQTTANGRCRSQARNHPPIPQSAGHAVASPPSACPRGLAPFPQGRFTRPVASKFVAANSLQARFARFSIPTNGSLNNSWAAFMHPFIIVALVIVPLALIALSALVGFVIVRDTRRRSGKWGFNLQVVTCPRCHSQAPSVRRPTSFRQAMWGGWTCKTCGCEMDKWGVETHPHSRESSA